MYGYLGVIMSLVVVVPLQKMKFTSSWMGLDSTTLHVLLVGFFYFMDIFWRKQNESIHTRDLTTNRMKNETKQTITCYKCGKQVEEKFLMIDGMIPATYYFMVLEQHGFTAHLEGTICRICEDEIQ
jgi:hypothetical protein